MALWTMSETMEPKANVNPTAASQMQALFKVSFVSWQSNLRIKDAAGKMTALMLTSARMRTTTSIRSQKTVPIMIFTRLATLQSKRSEKRRSTKKERTTVASN